MKHFRIIRSGMLLALVLAMAASLGLAQEPKPQGTLSPQAQMGTSFTYQGRLTDGDEPATGVYDFLFRLWDSAEEGNPIGGLLPVDDRTLSDGLLTVDLDFGPNALTGEARWLEIQVKRDADDDYTPLTPRQRLAPAPTALALPGLWTQQNDTSPNLIGGYSGNWVSDGVYEATISGGGLDGSPNRVTDRGGTIGGGEGNQAGSDNGLPDDSWFATISGGTGNTASGQWATISGGENNSASGDYTTIAGGSSNIASLPSASVGGGWLNVASGRRSAIGGGAMNTASAWYATIGGGHSNQASGEQATIAGGSSNTASGDETTVSGGVENSAGGFRATIGGGVGNEASGGRATVGGGSSNTASGDEATVSGGIENNAGGFRATISGGEGNEASGPDATVGGGSNNTASDQSGTVSGGDWNTAGGWSATVGGGHENSASGGGTTVAGGSANTAGGHMATVSGGEGNTATANWAAIGGGNDNAATGYAATVSGGITNTASIFASTVGGGKRNVASGDGATVGGGDTSTASGGNATIAGGTGHLASGWAAAVGGGNHNTASGQGATVSGGEGNTAGNQEATVGGGWNNNASGDAATVGGGGGNIASGQGATVPGGSNNLAQGSHSFAAGRRSRAYNAGCFVWGDSAENDVVCDVDNAWVARASGGVTFLTSPDNSTGVYVDAGGTSWQATSDRALKENLTPADGRAILETLASLSIQEYNLKSQDPGIRHIGLVAQDFATLGYGESDTAINMQDADGVALASIQGLYAENQELKARVDDLESRLAALEEANRAGGALRLPAGWLGLGGLLVVTGCAAVQYRRLGGRG